jgi:glucuronoarabinoxylan endo-1,4-beta-xylanase
MAHLEFRFLETRRGMQPRTAVALKTLAGLVLLSISLPAQAQSGTPSVAVNWSDVHQTIDGFGASSMYTGNHMTPSQADAFFSPTAGIGLSLLRIEVPANAADAQINLCTPAQQATARGAKVWATELSPPAAMKSNDDVDNGGSLLAGSYAAYATYQSHWVTSFQSTCGVNLYAISVQNEPDQTQSYESSNWSAQNFHDYILNNLGPTLHANNPGVKLIMPEPSNFGTNGAFLDSYANTTLSDAGSAAYVDIVGFHGYYSTMADSSGTYPLPASLGKRLWETEISDFGTPDSSMTSGLFYAQVMHNYLTIAQINAYNWWWLINVNNDNEGLTVADSPSDGSALSFTKRMWVLGQWSKFVRPGWVRMGATATPASGVYVSAFKDPVSGDFAIVAVNQNASDQPLSFALNGFTASSVTPWVTSASLDLAQQPNISAAGNSFSGTLLASSVTTFVGSASASSAQPQPPTNLTAIAR